MQSIKGPKREKSLQPASRFKPVAEQVTKVRGGLRQYRISGSRGFGGPPEAVGNLDFMEPQISLDWSISVKSY